MKAPYPWSTLPFRAQQVINAWIVREGGVTNGKDLGEAGPTSYGIFSEAIDVKTASPYALYVRRSVVNNTLTLTEAKEYAYYAYYRPRRAQFDTLYTNSPMLAITLFGSLAMGVGETGPGAPIDDWYRVMKEVFRFRYSGVMYVLPGLNELYAKGRNVDGEIHRWLAKNRHLFLDGMVKLAQTTNKPVAKGWVNRINAEADAYLAGSKELVNRHTTTRIADVDQTPRGTALSLTMISGKTPKGNPRPPRSANTIAMLRGLLNY